MYIPHIGRLPGPRRTPRFCASLAMVSCAALLAGCGSQRDVAGTGGDAGPLLTYARCMRAHAVPKFPDPSPTGGLIIPNAINTDAPAFKTAQQACGHLLRSASHAGSSESRRLQLLALAKCMRAHGVPDFADPTGSPPPPSSGNAIGADGIYLALGTARERQSPAFKHAAAVCGIPGPL